MIGESSFQLLQEDHLHFNVVPVTIEAASLIYLNQNDALRRFKIFSWHLVLFSTFRISTPYFVLTKLLPRVTKC